MCHTLYAQPIVLNNPNQTYFIFENCAAFHVKPEQKITLDSLLLHPDKYPFSPITQKTIQADANQAYWFRVQLHNPTSYNYFLRFFYASDMLVKMYEVDSNRHVQTGQIDFHGASTPDLFQRGQSILPLKIEQGQTHTLYFFVPHMGIPKLHMGVMSSLNLAKHVHYDDLLNGLGNGFLVIVAIYCLILSIRLRDRDNLLFALSAVLSLTVVLSTRGTLLEWPGQWPITLRDNYGIHVAISSLLNLLFTFSLLQLKQQTHWLYRIGVGLCLLIVFFMVVVLSIRLSGQDDRALQTLLGSLSAFASVLFNIVASLIIAVKGYRPGLFYAIGQTVFTISTTLFVASLYGALPFTFWHRNGTVVGTFVQTVFFILGLTYKVNLLKKNHEESIREQLRLTQENQHLVENQNRVLEEKVEQRTAELKASQAQLIQKEKLASLGELTAGIAHEIQNPLNFVNNFSEVSTELVQELKEEAQAGRTDDVLAIADDLTQNLQKITHHGKRAGSIVRGMLEHSRASTGEKQSTNLNALADEYLRLAYHGLRAKDKGFNCTIQTDFAPTLPPVDAVAQDIGRVLLNLFNNAFYAVHERGRNPGGLPNVQNSNSYSPTVRVSTRSEPGKVVICVRDNGTGIPDGIREKIFQPFFTTKPTGEGTGLGLSLSYDIITLGHGGSIIVDSQQGKGTEFIIELPVP
uniref:sensor histidine kinase n=1 Tax=Rudanella paleaurantiibacter TaxID=2614655 RepID=UPI001FE31911|nr:7TM diverse intracellular signaling domain-containing protein [Rudanella paleaurantiibacter]